MTARGLSLGLALLSASGVLGCDRLPGRPDEADRYQRPAEVRDFASLYGSNCSGCHGAEGRFGHVYPLLLNLYHSVSFLFFGLVHKAI